MEPLGNCEVLAVWDVVDIRNSSADGIELDDAWKDRPDTMSSL